jgi:hypothetical protein
MMKTLLVSVAACILSTGVRLLAQGNASITPKEIPEAFRGKYVLVTRHCMPEFKTESFKDDPKPFCSIETNRVLLADGQALQASVLTNDSATLLIEFAGVKYGWGISRSPPYTIISQRNFNPKAQKLYAGGIETNAIARAGNDVVANDIPVCIFKLLKID